MSDKTHQPPENDTARHSVYKELIARGVLANAVALLALLVVLFCPLPFTPSICSALRVVGVIVTGGLLFVYHLVRAAEQQPLDPAVDTPAAVWEDEFQNWNSGLGLRLMATANQLEVLNKLFELGLYLDTSSSPPRLDTKKRQEFIKLFESNDKVAAANRGEDERLVLFSGIPYSDRYLLTAILRGLRQLGNTSSAPRVDTSVDRMSGSTAADDNIHFLEIRYSSHQCQNALTVLSVLHNEQDTLLRASTASTSEQDETLLRPAKDVGRVVPAELLRTAGEKSEPDKTDR